MRKAKVDRVLGRNLRKRVRQRMIRSLRSEDLLIVVRYSIDVTNMELFRHYAKKSRACKSNAMPEADNFNGYMEGQEGK